MKRNANRKRMEYKEEPKFHLNFQTVLYCGRLHTLYHPFETKEDLLDFQIENPKFKVFIVGSDRMKPFVKLEVDLQSLTITDKPREYLNNYQI